MDVPANTGHPRRWPILAVLVVSLLVVVLDNTVLNVAMKTIADPHDGLGASQSQLEWAINSYTLLFAGLLFTWGILGDRMGRKRILLTGMALFGLASVASAYAQNPGELIAARALMGFGGAAVMPATLSIISNIFDPRERGKAIGAWAGSVGIGIAVGPILGGVLLEHFWWGSVFLINVPIVVAGIVAIVAMVPESSDPVARKIDVVGVLLSVLGLVLVVYGIIKGGDLGTFSKPEVWGTIALGVLVLAGFVQYERHSDHPALDVKLFRNSRFAAGAGAIGVTFFTGLGVMFFMSFYLQLVRGYSPVRTGLLFLPFAAAQLVFAPRSAALVKRYGSKMICALGIVFMAVGFVGYLTATATSPIWLLLLAFLIQGVGMAFVNPAATESIMSSVPREQAGVGAAVGNTVRQVGGALGVAILGTVLSSVYRNQIDSHLGVLPPATRHTASESVAATYGVAEKVGPSAAPIIPHANDAFINAMHWAAAGSLVIGLLGALVVAIYLPGRAKPSQGSTQDTSVSEGLSEEVFVEA
jgi:MFS transporter, DHA2 family, multidrug resistance protein